VSRLQSILLIEPEDHRRVMSAEYLHRIGFTVLTADTTDDGLTRAGDAHVFVTWIGVPSSFNAVELVRRVRQTDRTKHAPLIVLLTPCNLNPSGNALWPPAVTHFCRTLSARATCPRNPRRPFTSPRPDAAEPRRVRM
jgi:response regulator RpfG family c-di-GMP phosphodiesterase